MSSRFITLCSNPHTVFFFQSAFSSVVNVIIEMSADNNLEFDLELLNSKGTIVVSTLTPPPSYG